MAFLLSLGLAFVGLSAPLLFPDRSGIRVPALRTSALLALAAAAGLAADWVAHSL